MNIKLNPAYFLSSIMHIDYEYKYLYDFKSIKRVANESRTQILGKN